jgi:hypothetical protein
LVPGPDNGFYVVGGTGSYDYDCSGNPGGGSAYLVRLNDTGGIIWHRCLGGSSHDAATAACSNGSGGVIMAVNTRSSDHDVVNYHGGGDYWVVEVDTTGNIIWSNCYGTANTEVPLAICKATDGSVWINGFNYENYDDVYLVHTDSIGNLLHEKVISSSGQDRGTTIFALDNNLVFTAGYYEINNSYFSSLTHFGATDIFQTVFAPWSVGMDDKQNDELTLKMYPNPAKGILYVEKQNNNTKTKISLMSIDGKQMTQTILAFGNSQAEIDVSQFPKGIYWVRISSDSQISKSHKITIE